MILDIEQLHKTPKFDRGSGRTTDMLVEALQCADFQVRRVIIICETLRGANLMIQEMIELAKALEMSVSAVSFAERRVTVDNTVFMFVSISLGSHHIRGYRDVRFFIDHRAEFYARMSPYQDLFRAVEEEAQKHSVGQEPWK